VVFIDTGFHFDETLRYRDEIVEQLGLTLLVVRPRSSRPAFVAEYGADIQRTNPDLCCALNKIDPIAPLKADAEAWISGLRRDQSRDRANVPILLAADGEPLRVHPIATLSASDVEAYMRAHSVPEHPLRSQGFRSIGCAPCTRAIGEGEEERAGRWDWSEKTECGLHGRERREGATANALARTLPLLGRPDRRVS
jgi:phosphoadenosine phosphosulfate reductase